MAGRDGVWSPIPSGACPFSCTNISGRGREHVESWRDNGEYRVSLARFEDLFGDPLTGFRRLTAEAGLPANGQIAFLQPVRAATFAACSPGGAVPRLPRAPQNGPQPSFAPEDLFLGPGTHRGNAVRVSVTITEAIMRRMGYEPDGSALPISS